MRLGLDHGTDSISNILLSISLLNILNFSVHKNYLGSLLKMQILRHHSLGFLLSRLGMRQENLCHK